MGLFHVSVRLTGPTGRTVTRDLLVDTGATLPVIPQPLAEELELKPRRTQAVRTAGGRRDEWPVAEVRVAVDGREISVPCFIAPEGPALLGALALEGLFLAVDPVARRLVPVEGFVGSLGAAHRLGLAGRVKVKVEPSPAALLTQIRPPWSSTNFRASESPSPVPSRFFA
jgi:predicted aspartyl protease